MADKIKLSPSAIVKQVFGSDCEDIHTLDIDTQTLVLVITIEQIPISRTKQFMSLI